MTTHDYPTLHEMLAPLLARGDALVLISPYTRTAALIPLRGPHTTTDELDLAAEVHLWLASHLGRGLFVLA